MENVDTEDLFVLVEDGFAVLEDEFGPSFFIFLRNFDLNSHLLRREHEEILQQRVAPYIQRSVGFAEIYAMADRSGSRQVNYQVSAERLATVQKRLLQLGAPARKVQHAFAKAIGEDFFEHKHSIEKDDTFFGDSQKHATLRIVAIALSPAPIGVPTRNFRRRDAAELTAFCRKHVQQRG